MGISTHVLDTSKGRPADGIAVVLEREENDDTFTEIAGGSTDADGRLVMIEGEPQAGTYRLRFAIGEYFWRQGYRTFFPLAEITFVVEKTTEKYHVPLLLSPFGYSTYRGS